MSKKLCDFSSPIIIMRLPDLSPLKRMLLFTLSSMLERKQKPSQDLLAYAINTSPANISNLLNDLEKENWITISKASNRFSGELNQYTINWKKIESYAGENDYYEPTIFKSQKKNYNNQIAN